MMWKKQKKPHKLKIFEGQIWEPQCLLKFRYILCVTSMREMKSSKAASVSQKNQDNMEIVALVPNFEVHNQSGQNYYYSLQRDL